MGHSPWGHKEPEMSWQQLSTYAQEDEESLNGPTPLVRNTRSLSPGWTVVAIPVS